MKRTVSDVLRRGFENALANWPLILIRIAEGLVYLAIIIAAVVASIVPLVVSIGMSRTSLENPADAAATILDALAAHWMVFVWIFAIISFVVLLIVAIRSFVSAGCALVYIDGERRTASLPAPVRDQFRSFTGERWARGAKDGWWTVFWIYNIAWGVGGLIMIVPMIVVLGAMFALRGTGAGPVVAVGCIGAVVSVMFLIVVAIVTNIWTEKAIVDCMARNLGAMSALGSSWRELRTDTARHLAVAVIMMALAFAGSMILSSFSWMGNINHHAGLSFALLPLQFSSSIANTIFSTAIGAWFLACFAGLAVDSRP